MLEGGVYEAAVRDFVAAHVVGAEVQWRFLDDAAVRMLKVVTISSNALCMDDFILKFATISRNACQSSCRLWWPSRFSNNAGLGSTGVFSSYGES